MFVYFFIIFIIKILKNINLNENTRSSFIFLSNIYHLLNKKDKMYLYSFIFLFFTSIFNHQNKNKIINIIDKIAVYNIVYQGGYRLFKHRKSDELFVSTVICFIYVIYLYYFLIPLKSLSKKNKKKLHSLIHFSSSIGHHYIILTI